MNSIGGQVLPAGPAIVLWSITPKMLSVVIMLLDCEAQHPCKLLSKLMLSSRRFGQVEEVQLPQAVMGGPTELAFVVRIFMQEMRDRDVLVPGDSVKRWFTLFTVIAVCVHEADAPVVDGVELGVPVPLIVMPLPETEIPLVHVHDPAGIMITSPLPAVCVGPLMTAFTSLKLQEAAV
jgi:hypothetical protein